MVRNRLERIGISLPRHRIPQSQPRPVRRKVNRPRGLIRQEIILSRRARNRLREIFHVVGGDGEAAARDVHGGHDDVPPRELAIVGVQVFEASELAGDAACEPAVEGGRNVVLVHVLECRRGGGLAEVDEFVGAVGGADEHEAAAAKTGVRSVLVVK